MNKTCCRNPIAWVKANCASLAALVESWNNSGGLTVGDVSLVETPGADFLYDLTVGPESARFVSACPGLFSEIGRLVYTFPVPDNSNFIDYNAAVTGGVLPPGNPDRISVVCPGAAYRVTSYLVAATAGEANIPISFVDFGNRQVFLSGNKPAGQSHTVHLEIAAEFLVP